MTAIITPEQLTNITLTAGAHDRPVDGMCLLEAVAYLRGAPFSDHPACVSLVLGQMGRSLNDQLPDDARQLLVPLIPLLPGTAGDGCDGRRSYMALDWFIRVYTPAWLDLAGLGENASEIRSLDEIVDAAAAARAGPSVLRSRDKATAAWAAAGAAAWDAAWGAAGDAAWDAAGDDLAPTVTELQASVIDLYRRMASLRPETQETAQQ